MEYYDSYNYNKYIFNRDNNIYLLLDHNVVISIKDIKCIKMLSRIYTEYRNHNGMYITNKVNNKLFRYNERIKEIVQRKTRIFKTKCTYDLQFMGNRS